MNLTATKRPTCFCLKYIQQSIKLLYLQSNVQPASTVVVGTSRIGRLFRKVHKYSLDIERKYQHVELAFAGPQDAPICNQLQQGLYSSVESTRAIGGTNHISGLLRAIVALNVSHPTAKI